WRYWAIFLFCRSTGYIYTLAVYFYLIDHIINCSLVLLRKLPESRINKAETSRIDTIGLIIFIIMIGIISFIITQGYKIGWLNAVTVILFVIFLICIYIFFKVERVKKVPFIDLDLFKNRPYIGAVLANFLLNTGVGVIALLNM